MAKLKLRGTIETNTVNADSVNADSVNTEEALIKDSSLATVCRLSANPNFPVDISPDDEVSLGSAFSSCFQTNYMNGEVIRNNTDRIGTLEASSGLGSGYETLQQLSGRVGEVESRSTTNQTNIATNTSNIEVIDSIVMDIQSDLHILGRTVDDIHNNLPPETRTAFSSHTVLNGDLSLAAGGYKGGTLSIEMQGYYPVSVSSFNSGTARVVPYRTALTNRRIDMVGTQRVGKADLLWAVINTGTTGSSPTVTVEVLWEKLF